MLIRRLGCLGMLCGMALLTSCAQPGAADRPPPQMYTVVIEGIRFRPDTIAVNVGDSITWVNRDLVPHTATSTAAGFDSRLIEANKSWQLTVDRRGDVEYTCSFHPTMRATLHVR
jgi:plastocyanin